MEVRERWWVDCLEGERAEGCCFDGGWREGEGMIVAETGGRSVCGMESLRGDCGARSVDDTVASEENVDDSGEIEGSDGEPSSQCWTVVSVLGVHGWRFVSSRAGEPSPSEP